MEINYENYIELKNRGLLRREIAREFNLTEDQIKRTISKNGWAIKPPVFLNKTAFEDYTEESCYWAGFLAADGCVDNKNRVRVMLNYDDIGHLQKLKNYLQSTHKISENTDKYYRASFELTSPELCDQLEFNFNIIPVKSMIMKFPKSIPKQLIKHYIRGYFDGDGSICESFSNTNSITKSLYATFCSGSPDFIVYLYEYLSKQLLLEGHLQDFRPSSEKHQIKYNVNDAKKLLSWMYKDSIVYLDRKYKLYNTIVVENIRQTR